MTRMWRYVPAVVVLALASVPASFAQAPNTPRLGYAYPAGGQQGTTVEVRVGGRFLDATSDVLVSGGGVRARIVEVDRPLTPMQLTALREQAAELLKTARTPADRQAIADIRMRIGDSVRRNQNPVLSDIATLSVSIDAGAAPGPRQIRLEGPLGLSNAVTFVVGELREFREKDEKASKADTELAVTIPATVNGRLIPGDVDRAQFPVRQQGQYMPGDVDRYRFPARKGQELVCAVSARELTPYLADAVPGWFQAVVRLLDASGDEVASQDDFRFQPDPVLHATIPSDGEYVLEVRDALYRGREDFVYRVAIGELPFITGVFPLGGPAGRKTAVQLAGWNLGGTRMTTDGSGTEPGVSWLTIRSNGIQSNRVPFATDTMPEVVERESNDRAKAPQRVSLPVIVNGRVQAPGDTDVFAFQGKAGEQVVAEVRARRLGSPLDASLELTDAAGRRIGFSDDVEDKGAGLVTHHADSRLTATLPSSGTYLVRLADVQRAGGADYGYRLHIGPPRPDFELRVTPAELNAGAGATIPFTVHALRRDGFAGEIAIRLSDAPAGFAVGGAVVPAGVDRVRMTLSVAPFAGKGTSVIRLEGRASIGGRTVTRPAVPADDLMQAFAYHHLVPRDALRMSVLQRGSTRAVARVLAPSPLTIPAGGSARVRVALPLPPAFTKYEFELSEPPDGVTLGSLVLAPNGAEFVLQADAAKARPGLRGNLIVVVSGERVPQPNQPNQPAAVRRLPLVTLPAIAFEIVK